MQKRGDDKGGLNVKHQSMTADTKFGYNLAFPVRNAPRTRHYAKWQELRHTCTWRNGTCTWRHRTSAGRDLWGEAFSDTMFSA